MRVGEGRDEWGTRRDDGRGAKKRKNQRQGIQELQDESLRYRKRKGTRKLTEMAKEILN